MRLECGESSTYAHKGRFCLHAGATRPEEEEEQQDREGPEGPECVQKISFWNTSLRSILTWLKHAMISTDLYLERRPRLCKLWSRNA